MRAYCEEEFAKQGLNVCWPQMNLSHNLDRGTLRGLHFQAEPSPEIKVVRCVQGQIWDVVVDIRQGSPTYRQWAAFELSAENGAALYIPGGLAHGFLTLQAGTMVHYQMSAGYVPNLAGGVRWNDPAIGIAWPESPVTISARDSALPLLVDLPED